MTGALVFLVTYVKTLLMHYHYLGNHTTQKCTNLAVSSKHHLVQ